MTGGYIQARLCQKPSDLHAAVAAAPGTQFRLLQSGSAFDIRGPKRSPEVMQKLLPIRWRMLTALEI